MKKIITLSIAALALASCTADYDCACTYTDVSGGTTTISSNTTTLIGVTQTQAEQDYNCVSYEQSYTDNTGTVSTSTQDCTITKK
ncbi:MAG: hypothetical protein QNK23_01425 [Crocinitomicaceae bacterium]|nr:hypothetical protein [Crocinitomicaceae bacterium]